MKELSNYRNLNELVDNTMNILDEDFQVPENLTDKIMSNRPQLKQQARVRKLNFAVYAQIAAVLAAGVFLGVVLGKNANTKLLSSKEAKKHQSLIEYKISHHLSVDRTKMFQ